MTFYIVTPEQEENLSQRNISLSTSHHITFQSFTDLQREDIYGDGYGHG